MSSFVRLDIKTALACQGGSLLGTLYPTDLLSSGDVLAIDEQESLAFSFSRTDRTGQVRALASSIVGNLIASVVWSDGSFDEWRIASVDTRRGGNDGGVITVTANPLMMDLSDGADSSTGKGLVSTLSNGIRVFAFTTDAITLDSLFDTYIIPACPSWVSKGTIDSSLSIASLSWDRATPQAVAVLGRDAIRALGATAELRLRRNGTTDYKLDCVAQVGASANVPLFHPKTSLQAIRRSYDTSEQGTRVFVKGGTAPDGLPGIPGRARWKVSSVVGNVVTLIDRNGAAAPIAFDNQFLNNYLLRVSTGRTFQITGSSASGGTVTCSGGVSTLAADEDVEFRVDEPLTNTRTTTTRYAISAVPDGTHITCGASNPITTDNQYLDWYAKIWSASVGGSVIATTRISGSVAATDVVAVASSSGVNNTHYVEFVQLDGAGEVFSYLDHPTYVQAYPTGYGVKVKDLAVERAFGVTQLIPNAWMRTWTNSSNPPDGWTLTGSGGSLAGSRNSNTSYTRYGGYSWRFQTGAANHPQAKTPAFYPNYTSGQTSLSVRAFVYFSTFAFSGGAVVTLYVYARTVSGGNGTLLGSVSVTPVGSANGITEVSTGAWVEMKVKDITLSGTSAPYGCHAILDAQNPAITDAYDLYVDAIEAFGFSDCPNSACEFGDATILHQSGNLFLANKATPVPTYEVAVVDLERLDPTLWSRNALTIGGSVRAYEPDIPIDTTVRLIRYERDHLRPESSRVTLANRTALMTSFVETGINAQRKIVSAIQQQEQASQATPFVALTSATTVPTDNEIATGTSGAPSVTLGTDSAVTYVPPSTTSPKTAITVGTPPSRLPTSPLL